LLAPLSDPAAIPWHLERDVVKRVQAILRALKFSNLEVELAAELVGVAHASLTVEWKPVEVRRLLSDIARDKRTAAIALWSSEPVVNSMLVEEANRTLSAGYPLAVSDLAIAGKDLMTTLAIKPGPSIGRILAVLRDRVIEDPALNTRDTLLAEAQRLELAVGRDH
jgi:hypothetical protein